jgi:DNA-binding CsgD family transcriptional regulator
MPERPRKRGEPTNRVGRCADGDRGCGRITVGTRSFIVSFAPDLPHKRFSAEVCRFELAGRTLIVTETENQCGAKEVVSGDEIASRLTGRELEIAVLVAQGYATKNIAFKLQISEWTVSTYLRRIFAKLDVDSRAAMVYRCAALIDRVSGAPESVARLGKSIDWIPVASALFEFDKRPALAKLSPRKSAL